MDEKAFVFYAICGKCGHMLGKYGSGSAHETECPKCGARLLVESHERDLKVTVISTKQERKESRATA